MLWTILLFARVMSGGPKKSTLCIFPPPALGLIPPPLVDRSRTLLRRGLLTQTTIPLKWTGQ